MLRELNPQKGDYIIQSAAASTLGRMIIQVAHYYGFKVPFAFHDLIPL